MWEFLLVLQIFYMLQWLWTQGQNPRSGEETKLYIAQKVQEWLNCAVVTCKGSPPGTVLFNRDDVETSEKGKKKTNLRKNSRVTRSENVPLPLARMKRRIYHWSAGVGCSKRLPIMLTCSRRGSGQREPGNRSPMTPRGKTQEHHSEGQVHIARCPRSVGQRRLSQEGVWRLGRRDHIWLGDLLQQRHVESEVYLERPE